VTFQLHDSLLNSVRRVISVVVNALVSISEVALHRARSLLGWATTISHVMAAILTLGRYIKYLTPSVRLSRCYFTVPVLEKQSFQNFVSIRFETTGALGFCEERSLQQQEEDVISS